MAALQLRERDINIFKAIYACRLLTTPQIGARFFPREKSEPRRYDVRSNKYVSPRCRKRLRRFWEEGYLYRTDLPATTKEGRKPFMYFLDEGAVAVLAKVFNVPVTAIKWRPRDNEIKFFQLAHFVAVNDVRISIGIDAFDRGLTIVKWESENDLRSRKMEVFLRDSGNAPNKDVVGFRPDGYFVLKVPGGLSTTGGAQIIPCYLEVDRATEHAPLDPDTNYSNTFTTKIKKYLSHYASGDHRKQFGFDDIRLLTVTTDLKRVEKLINVTQSLGGNQRFWFTTFDQLLKPLSALTKPIWQVVGKQGNYAIVE